MGLTLMDYFNIINSYNYRRYLWDKYIYINTKKRMTRAGCELGIFVKHQEDITRVKNIYVL